MDSLNTSRNEIFRMNIHFATIEMFKNFTQKHLAANKSENNYQTVSLIYITEGSVSVRQNEANTNLTINHFAFINRENTAYVSANGQNTEATVLTFDINKRYLNFQFNQDLSTTSPLLKNYLTELVEENDRNDAAVCQILTALIIVKYFNQSDSISPQQLNQSSTSQHKVERTIDYIHSHYEQNMTLDKLAEVANINKYYLVHMFKNHTGMSPIEYLIAFRIKQAKYLLSHSDITVAEISLSVGFSSQSYFSKIFKRHTGLTPLKYRQMHNHHKE